MAKKIKESFENIKRVVDVKDDDIDTVGGMDIVMTDAYDDSIKTDMHIQAVKDELDKQAECVTPEKPEDPKPVDSAYGGKLKLDEELSDFKLNEDKPARVYEDDDDEHLDFDMFDFITGLVTDTWPKPINPDVGVKPRKFQTTGQDDYRNNENKGIPQVSTDGVDTITVYADTVEDFEFIRRVCDLYKFNYVGPTPRRSAHSRWKFSFDIKVPMASSSYPMSAEDYFADLYGSYTMERDGKEVTILYKVMPKAWADQYQKKIDKINKEADKTVAARDAWKAVKALADKQIDLTMDDDRPFEEHFKELIQKLKDSGLTYKQGEVKKYFFDNV